MKRHTKTVATLIVVLFGGAIGTAEVLPPADAPVFFDVVRAGKPAASLVLSQAASETERIAAAKIQTWLKDFAGAELPTAVAPGPAEPGNGRFIMLGTAQNQPIIAELVQTGDGGAADLPFLSDEGFGIQTLTRGDAKYLIIAGRTPTGVLQGAIYARDFLLDVLPPDEGVVVREVKLVRSPALPVRGPYLLPQYGVTPLQTLDHWKHIIDRMAEGGINRIHWWIAGMYPSTRHPETFEITQTKMSVDDIRALCRFAQARGMTFVVGGGGFFWHGVQQLGKNRPEIAAVGTGGLCPSHPESQRLMVDYALEWLETVPEADGLWIEPRDEGGFCTCERCSVRLDEFNSRHYGQSEIVFLKTLMKKVWARNPKHLMVWLVEYHSDIKTMPHYDDPLYFERIREMKDPRIEWQVVWEQFKLPGPRNQNVPVPFFTRHAQHWDKPYWPDLQNVFAHARMCAEQGYLGYSNAWEIGFASNDWYIHDVPYPVDLIPETLTNFGFREACWEPGQTWDEFIDRVHRRWFSREVPRALAEDMLYLRQYITKANHTMDHASPMDFSEKKPLLGEVERVKAVADAKAREGEAKRLLALVETLRMTRDEALPKISQIEARIAEWKPNASRKSRATFELMNRAMADSRRIYRQAVPDDAAIDAALKDLEPLVKSLAAARSQE
jgi:hypothetical protein